MDTETAGSLENMNRALDSIKNFKRRSVFFHFYSLILAMVLLLISIFSIYIYRFYIANQNDQRYAAQKALLEQISGKIDNSFMLLTESGNAIWQNPDLIPTVIVPSLEKKEQNFSATSFLAQNVTFFEYFDRLILHEQTKDIVYSSAGAVTTLENSSESELLSSCISGTNRTLLLEAPHQYDVSLVRYGREYYMVWRFIEGRNRYLGSLIAKMNMESVFAGLEDTLADSGYRLLITDPDGEELFRTGEEQNGDIITNELTSDQSGFKFSLVTNSAYAASPLSYFKKILPFLVCVILAGIVLSLFTAERVYNPINQLLFALPVSSRGPDQGKSELDVLTMTLQDMMNDKAAAEEFRRQVQPEIEENLLARLLEGSIEETESVMKQLADVGSGLQENGKYQVLIIYFPKMEGVDTVVQFMAFRQIRSRVDAAAKEEGISVYFLRPNGQQMSVVLHFPKDMSLAKCKTMSQRITIALKSGGQTDQSVTLSAGEIYQGLMSIGDSYSTASESLRKTLYYQSDDPEEALKNEEGYPDDSYLTSGLDRFRSLFEKRELLIAQELLNMLLKDIQSREEDTDGLRVSYGQVLSVLGEIILETNPEKDEKARLSMADAQKELRNIRSKDDLYPFMSVKTDEIMKYLRNLLNNRQVILVTQARNYIKMNYSNCDLSIHEVSESLGISDPYLSSIFNEYTGESPLTFLNSYRIEIAKQLLAESKMIIKDVGFNTGFNTIQNFNRVFKRFTGMTPGEYRKMNQ